MNNLSIAPLLRHAIGFDHLDRVFDNLYKLEDSKPSYPPYNIEKLDENSYEITMAVAGFSQEELDITVDGDTLTIRGINTEKTAEEKRQYLHKGIATRAFERQFNLAEHVKVANAGLDHGLLTIRLQREIPEEAKPRSIVININK